MSGSKKKPKPKDSRLDSFLREATAVLSSHRDMTPEAQVKLKAIAARLNLPEELYKKGLRLLANPQGSVPKTRWEKSFVKYLDQQFSLLPGKILTGPKELRAKQYGMRKFQLTQQQCEHWIARVAEKKGIACISQSEALEFAQVEAKRLVGKKQFEDPDDVDRVFNTSKRLGVTQEDCEQLVQSLVGENRTAARQEKRSRTVKISATIVGVLLLGGCVFYYITSKKEKGLGGSGVSTNGNSTKIDPNKENPVPKNLRPWLPKGLEVRVQSWEAKSPQFPSLVNALNANDLIRQQAVRNYCRQLEFTKKRFLANDQDLHEVLEQDDWSDILSDICSVQPNFDVTEVVLDELARMSEEGFDGLDPVLAARWSVLTESALLKCLQKIPFGKAAQSSLWYQQNRPALEHEDRSELVEKVKKHKDRFAQSVLDKVTDHFREQGVQVEFEHYKRLGVEIDRFVGEENQVSDFEVLLAASMVSKSSSTREAFLSRLLEGFSNYGRQRRLKILQFYVSKLSSEHRSLIEKVFFETYPNGKVAASDDLLMKTIWFHRQLSNQPRVEFLSRTQRKDFLKARIKKFVSTNRQIQQPIAKPKLLEAMLLVDLILDLEINGSGSSFSQLYFSQLDEPSLDEGLQEETPKPVLWQDSWKELTERTDWNKATLESKSGSIAKVLSVLKDARKFDGQKAEFLLKSAQQSIGKPKEILFRYLVQQSLQNPWVKIKIADLSQLDPSGSSSFRKTYLADQPDFANISEVNCVFHKWKKQALLELQKLNGLANGQAASFRYLQKSFRRRTAVLNGMDALEEAGVTDESHLTSELVIQRWIELVANRVDSNKNLSDLVQRPLQKDLDLASLSQSTLKTALQYQLWYRGFAWSEGRLLNSKIRVEDCVDETVARQFLWDREHRILEWYLSEGAKKEQVSGVSKRLQASEPKRVEVKQ